MPLPADAPLPADPAAASVPLIQVEPSPQLEPPSVRPDPLPPPKLALVGAAPKQQTGPAPPPKPAFALHIEPVAEPSVPTPPTCPAVTPKPVTPQPAPEQSAPPAFTKPPALVSRALAQLQPAPRPGPALHQPPAAIPAPIVTPPPHGKRREVTLPLAPEPQQPTAPDTIIAAAAPRLAAQPEAPAPNPEPRPAEAAVRRQPVEVEFAGLDRSRQQAQFRLVLLDDHMGRVSLHLAERAGLIDLIVSSDKPATVRSLRDSLPALVEALGQHNLRAEPAFPPLAASPDHADSAHERERRERRHQESRPRFRARRIVTVSRTAQ